MFTKVSTDDRLAAYASNHNIYSQYLPTGKITRLTNDGTWQIINDTFDCVYEEELNYWDSFR